MRIAIAVLRWRGLYAVGRRAAGAAEGGKAEFPGGKVEPGESPAEAAAREALEETGLPVRILGQLAEVASGSLTLHFFAAEPAEPQQETQVGPPAAPPLAAPFMWVGLDELRRLDFPAANAVVVASLTG